MTNDEFLKEVEMQVDAAIAELREEGIRVVFHSPIIIEKL